MRIFIAFLLLIASLDASAANRFWVPGGTGNWNSTTNWATTTGGASGASVPGAADTATIDANSGASTFTVTVDAPGASVTSFTINNTNATVLLNAAVNVSGTLTLTIGALNGNGQNVTSGTFSSSNTNTRTLTMGAGTWEVTGTGTVWNMNTSTGMALTSGGTIKVSNASATAISLGFGGLDFSNTDLLVTASTGTLTLSGTNSKLKSLNLTGYTGQLQAGNAITFVGNLTYGAGMTVADSAITWTLSGTSPQTITSNSVVANRNLIINGATTNVSLADDLDIGGRIFTLTAGTFNANNKNFSAMIFQSDNTNTRTLTMGNGTWTANKTSPTSAAFQLNLTTSNLTLTSSGLLKIVGSAAALPDVNLGGQTINNLWFSGSTSALPYKLQTSGTATLADYKIDAGLTGQFYDAGVYVMSSFSPQGSAGNVVTLDHTNTGGGAVATLQIGSRASVDYLSVSNLTFIPGIPVFAGSHSTNGGNVAGISFATPENTAGMLF